MAFYKFNWTSKIHATLTMGNTYIGFLGCGFQLFGLYLPHQNSHTTVITSKSTLQENVTPIKSFVAETYYIPIIVTKGPQLISETNIPLLIPEWWRLCTDITTAYACMCGNKSVHV